MSRSEQWANCNRFKFHAQRNGRNKKKTELLQYAFLLKFCARHGPRFRIRSDGLFVGETVMEISTTKL
jgi:hypothetical protein